MAAYEITCVIKCNSPNSSAPDYGHVHITDVGIGDRSRATVAQVYKLMSEGDTFYTYSRSTGRLAMVDRYRCTTCDTPTLRSHTDRVWDDNLDNLPACR